MAETKTAWSKGSDINFVMADGVKRAPIGIAETFVFRVENVYFAVRCYVVESANYQLLLGTEFLVATGAGLFPRWGKIIITLPSRIDIDAHCKRITVEVGAPPLLEEDADEYDEEEFDLQVPANIVGKHPTFVVEGHPAYFMVPDTTAIQIGMKDLIGDIDGSMIPDIEIPLKDVQKALQEGLLLLTVEFILQNLKVGPNIPQHDYRYLNDKIHQDPEPVDSIPEMLAFMGEGETGSLFKVDADRGFNQIVMTEEAVWASAFEMLGEL